MPLGCEETELCIRYTPRTRTERFVLTHDAVVHHVVPASRLSWRYFRSRCWAEGLSKAAVSSLVGSKDGLSSERQHLLRAMPRELGRSVCALPRQPKVSATGSSSSSRRRDRRGGPLRGRAAVRRTPIVPAGDELGQLISTKGNVTAVPVGRATRRLVCV